MVFYRINGIIDSIPELEVTVMDRVGEKKGRFSEISG